MLDNIKWDVDTIKNWLEDAVNILRKLPAVKIQTYISTWPSVINAPLEKLREDKKPIKWQTSSFEISRMELVFEWIKWIDDADDRKIIWARARKLPWKIIAYKIGMGKTTLWQRWNMAIKMIYAHLNNENEDLYKKNMDFLLRYLRVDSL